MEKCKQSLGQWNSCKDVDLHIYTCGGSFTFPASFTQPFIPKHLPLPGKVVGLCQLFRSCQVFRKRSNASFSLKDDAGKGRNRKPFLSFLGCFFTQRSFIHWFISEHCACSGRMMYFSGMRSVVPTVRRGAVYLESSTKRRETLTARKWNVWKP